MKVLDKITLILFSTLILIIAIILALLMFGWIRFSTIAGLFADAIASETATRVILVSCAVCVILAIRAIFFGGSSETSEGMTGEGILLENESGKLLITRDTLENLVNGVAKGFENTQSVSTKVILDKQNTLKVFVSLVVLQSTIINELSVNLQNRIKEVVKNATGLEVKAIDVKIKNVAAPEVKKEV